MLLSDDLVIPYQRGFLDDLFYSLSTDALASSLQSRHNGAFMTIYLVIVYFRNGMSPDVDAFECRDKALKRLDYQAAKYSGFVGASVVMQENDLCLA